MPKNNRVRDVVDAVKGLAESAPYTDLARPAAIEIGGALQDISKSLRDVIQASLRPISGMVWSFNQIADVVGETLEKIFESTPHSRITTPEPAIAGPALEALRFVAHREELRNLYINLIASSMDKETTQRAHPSFVEVIKHLSPDEARICRYFFAQKNPLGIAFPVLKVRVFKKSDAVEVPSHVATKWNKIARSAVPMIENLSMIGEWAECENPDLEESYIDNMLRLGLIRIDEEPLGDKSTYETIESGELPRKLMEFGKTGEFGVSFQRRTLLVTQFGRQFLYACVDELAHKKLEN